MNQFTMPPITPIPFNGLIAFAWVGVFLIIGMVLRSTFPAFRKYLIPACIIGGTVGFICQSFDLLNKTGFILDSRMLQIIVYHLFNLTWVYLGLRLPAQMEKGSSSTAQHVVWYSGIFPMLMFIGIAIGAATSTFTNFFGFSSGPDSLGILTGYGFIQGPGQALTIATVWEAATSFTGLADFALAASAMGFAVAIVVGIFLMNIIARKKGIEIINNPSPSEECGYYNECDDVDDAGKITTSPSNIDVFAWHIALGLGTYFLTLVIATFLVLVLPVNIKPFVWSIFFVMCSIVGMGVRIFIIKIGKKRLLCNGVNARISNTLIDFLVCATFISIQVGNIVQYVWPYLLSCVVMTLTMAGMCWIYCSKLKEEGPETFAFLFGCVTGTISTGLILLRMVDPQGKSQGPVYMAICRFFTTPITLLQVAIVHMQVLHGMSIFLLIAAALSCAVILAGVVYMAKLPKTEKAWQAD